MLALLMWCLSVQGLLVEDLAAGLADTTRHALGHAQTSLETAQQNWTSLLVGTSRWADEAGIAPRPVGPNPLESAFGELWNDAVPRINPFKVCTFLPALSLSLKQP